MEVTKRRLTILVGAVATVGLVLLLRSTLSGPGETEEALLLAAVDRVAQAAEKRDIKGVRRHLSKQYADADGRSYADINRLLVFQFFRGGALSVYLLNKNVEVDYTAKPLAARMTAAVVLTRGPKVKKLVDLVPDGARALSFELSFRKQDDVWMLVAAKWEPIGDIKGLLQ